MTEDWERSTLGNVADWLSGGTPRKSESQYWDGDIPWISGASLKSDRLWDSERRVTDKAVGNGTRLAPVDSTLILVRGMSLIEEIRIGRTLRPMAFNQDVKALVPKREAVDPAFLTYLLLGRVDELLGMVHRAGHGTGVLDTDQLKGLAVALPPLDVQRRVAGVLGNLDDLIDTDQRLAATLDEQARLAGMHIFATSEVQETVPLAEIADVHKGYSYKSAELIPGGKWLVNLKNVGRDGSFQERGFKPLAATPKSVLIVENGDIVVSQTDLTQSRDVIARPVRVRRCGMAGELVASLDLVIVRPRPPITTEYLLALLSQPDFREHALGYCNGTTVLHMGARALPEYKAPLLHAEVITNFSERVRPLLEASDALLDEARELRRTRDELLPLLISGRVAPGEVA